MLLHKVLECHPDSRSMIIAAATKMSSSSNDSGIYTLS
jgi:hypothetical protein